VPLLPITRGLLSLKVRASHFTFSTYHFIMSDPYDLTEEEQAELNAELEEGYADIESK
jgi:hypothetical protein